MNKILAGRLPRATTSAPRVRPTSPMRRAARSAATAGLVVSSSSSSPTEMSNVIERRHPLQAATLQSSS
jgi:hypothetical protein